MTLAGLIYMFPIEGDTRMRLNEVGNLKLFESLCGSGGLEKVHMVTSRWELPCEQLEARERREEEYSGCAW